MRIKKLELKNFKRFSDLTIDCIPDTAKLVLLIGSNGSGKSCVFDAFDWLKRGIYKAMPYPGEESNFYYRKNIDQKSTVHVQFDQNIGIEKTDNNAVINPTLAKKFIGRSSIRIIPKINKHGNPEDIADDKDSPLTYTDNDSRFINDVYAYILNVNNALREPVFSGKTADTVKIFENFIEPLNQSLLKIFGENTDTTIQINEFQDGNPIAHADLFFKKGEKKISYSLLSHGEKQVITLLINFIVRKKYYEDSILFIDEMDCHLNTALQKTLLEEIVTKWIPDTSQLWTASHALGFIDYAKSSPQAEIIDFDLLNFDKSQVLTPEPKENYNVYEIAVGKEILSKLFKGMRVIFVENTDEKLYSSLNLDKTVFVKEIDKKTIYHRTRTSEFSGIIDRDYLTDEELIEMKSSFKKLRILPFYSIENLIYHPDNLSEYYSKHKKPFERSAYISNLIKEKNKVLDMLSLQIATIRCSYPFYSEPEFVGKDIVKKFRPSSDNYEATSKIVSYLKSDDFDDFYKVLSMKDYCKIVPERQNLSKSDLTQTNWFKAQIESLIKDI